MKLLIKPYWLEVINYYPKINFCFWSDISAEDVLYYAKTISNALDNGEKPLDIFLDCVKAYDAVNLFIVIFILTKFSPL